MSSVFIPSSTETAVANGDTRTLNLYHAHTGESIEATFRINGSYDPAVLARLNYFLRDWRNNDETQMDPRLFDVLWEVYRTAGAARPIVVVSAYRSPQTNAMLRRRSHAVAEHSQHILGRAMDTTMPGMSMEKIREIGMRLQRGGVGYYPSANFVHLDVGSVRYWPRMNYEQLARVFPDGKSVDLAADGRALPRYEEARAEIAARNGLMSDVPQSAPSVGGLFAWLFGNHDEERGEEKEAEAVRPQAIQLARARHGRTEVASLSAKIDTPPRSTPVATAVSLPAPDKNTPPNDATPASANRVLVAALGSAANSLDNKDAAANGVLNTGKRRTFATQAPLPPLRPALPRTIAAAFADAPMPPLRPASLTGVAALAPDQSQGKRSTQAAAAAGANTQLARASNLPVVITQGPRDRLSVPRRVLAFASDTTVQEQDPDAEASKTPGETLNQPTTQPPTLAGRLSQAKSRGLAANVANASFPVPSILGPTFTGLRKAARFIPNALSNTPSAEYVSAFNAATASDLDAGHFTGAAAKPLSLEQGFVNIGERGKN